MMTALIAIALALPLSAAVLLFLLRNARWLHPLAIAFSAAEALDLLLVAAATYISGPCALGRYWRADSVGGFFLFTIACIFVLAMVYARSWLQDHETAEEMDRVNLEVPRVERAPVPSQNANSACRGPRDAGSRSPAAAADAQGSPQASLVGWGSSQQVRSGRTAWVWTSPGFFYAFAFLFVFTMVGVCLAANLGLMWIMLEGTTLSSALLVGFEQTEGALEAGWKYLILCSVGIAFALFGTIVFYLGAVKAGVPPVLALDWPTLHLLSANLKTSAPLLHLSFIFLLVGFGTKIGLAPMHSWLPDAHAEAPAPISALLSAVLLGCAFYCLLRYEALMPGSAGVFARHLLLFFGGASMLLAALFSVVQKDLKRLFAYSSMEHMGLIAVGIGVGTPLGLYGALLHLLNHALAKTLLFCSAGEVKRDCGTLHMAAIRGLLRQQPATGAALLTGGAAIIGMPPLALFVSEFAILAAAFAAGHLVTGFVVLLSLAVVLAAFLRHFLPLLSGGSTEVVPARIRGLPTLVFSMATMMLLIFGVHVPGVIRQAIERAVQVLHG